ncbi:hypothetical protein [Lysinibacillus sphaericus]|uniref:hypothetical protein n=1 Tax=Lysinibacillus sphaericus TaxID=1421 RepID=UPI003CFF96A3
MRYCVTKGTTKVIDGSLNKDEIMYQNAKSAGFTLNQVEILTQEQYDARKALEPVLQTLPTDKERIDQLENVILKLLGEM